MSSARCDRQTFEVTTDKLQHITHKHPKCQGNEEVKNAFANTPNLLLSSDKGAGETEARYTQEARVRRLVVTVLVFGVFDRSICLWLIHLPIPQEGEENVVSNLCDIVSQITIQLGSQGSVIQGMGD